jgi:PAS domain S-box-containing protein
MARGVVENKQNREISTLVDRLSRVFAAAAVGDFSKDAPEPEDSDAVAEIYVGVQIMLDVIREKISELANLNSELERRVAERTSQLERSQAQLRSVVEHSPNYIIMVDRDLKITYINRTGGDDPTSSLIGQTMGTFSDDPYREKIQGTLRDVLSTGEPAEFEFASIGHEGRAWYRMSAGPIFENDRITGLSLSVADITSSRNVQLALEKEKVRVQSAQGRDQALLNSIGEGLVVIDQHGDVAIVNPVGARMLGYSQAELIGKWFPSAFRAFNADGEQIDPMERPAIQAISQGRAVTKNAFYQRKDGTIFPVGLNISPVIIDGRPAGAVEVFRDITREKELEQAKEEFVSLASHQLRTPATGVKAYVSMLLDGYGGEMSDRQREFLEKVFDSNERQLQIVGDMLNVARLDAGRLSFEPEMTLLSDLIDHVVEEQRATIRERRQQLKFKVEKIRAEVDPGLMRMVIENLLSNASKYTPEEGEIEVVLQADPLKWYLKVSDTGVGISDKDVPRLFKRFSRIENELSTRVGGTGLGLYMSQHIASLHGGVIEVHSQVGKGSCFMLKFPLIQSRRSN